MVIVRRSPSGLLGFDQHGQSVHHSRPVDRSCDIGDSRSNPVPDVQSACENGQCELSQNLANFFQFSTRFRHCRRIAASRYAKCPAVRPRRLLATRRRSSERTRATFRRPTSSSDAMNRKQNISYFCSNFKKTGAKIDKYD